MTELCVLRPKRHTVGGLWEQYIILEAGYSDVIHHDSCRFVMDPENDPLKAKQETLMVPPHTPTRPIFQTSRGYRKI